MVVLEPQWSVLKERLKLFVERIDSALIPSC
jgi:hypothetical protein